MAAAMPAAGLAGGIVQGTGAILRGQMTANTLNAQAKMQRVQAGEARQAGEFNAFRQQIAAGHALGRATAAYGASGVSPYSTSAQAVLMAGAMNAELDRQNIIHGADIKAINYENQSSLDSFGADSALQGSYFTALGDVLGSAGGAAGAFVGASGGGAGGGGGGMSPADLTAGEVSSLKTNIDRLNPNVPEEQGLGL